MLTTSSVVPSARSFPLGDTDVSFSGISPIQGARTHLIRIVIGPRRCYRALTLLILDPVHQFCLSVWQHPLVVRVRVHPAMVVLPALYRGRRRVDSSVDGFRLDVNLSRIDPYAHISIHGNGHWRVLLIAQLRLGEVFDLPTIFRYFAEFLHVSDASPKLRPHNLVLNAAPTCTSSTS